MYLLAFFHLVTHISFFHMTAQKVRYLRSKNEISVTFFFLYQIP